MYAQDPPRGLHLSRLWAGDHAPRHVHVYRDGRLVLKWDLDHRCAMAGSPPPRVLALIAQLEGEGLL